MPVVHVEARRRHWARGGGASNSAQASQLRGCLCRMRTHSHKTVGAGGAACAPSRPGFKKKKGGGKKGWAPKQQLPHNGKSGGPRVRAARRFKGFSKLPSAPGGRKPPSLDAASANAQRRAGGGGGGPPGGRLYVRAWGSVAREGGVTSHTAMGRQSAAIDCDQATGRSPGGGRRALHGTAQTLRRFSRRDRGGGAANSVRRCARAGTHACRLSSSAAHQCGLCVALS